MRPVSDPLAGTGAIDPDPSVPPGRRPARLVVCLLLFFLGGGLAIALLPPVFRALEARSQANRDRIDASVPSPSLSPEEVVHQQMESLRAAVEDPQALITCYSLAAPTNRAITGPFERFAALVNQGPYVELGHCQDYQLGSAQLEGDVAAVLVSLHTAAGMPMAFRFVLAKQSHAPYRECWMTDGVFPLLPEPASSTATASEAARVD